MAAEPPVYAGNDAAIMARVIQPEEDDLQVAAAKAFLAMRFGPRDLDRIHELVIKNQDDALTPAEKADLESYLRVSSLLDLMHAKARHCLKKHA